MEPPNRIHINMTQNLPRWFCMTTFEGEIFKTNYLFFLLFIMPNTVWIRIKELCGSRSTQVKKMLKMLKADNNSAFRDPSD